MKNLKLLFVVILFLVIKIINAQDFEQSKFGAMTLNNITINELMPENASTAWSSIRAKFGIPKKEYQTTKESTKKYFEYSGAMFIYDDNLGDFMLLLVEITSPNYVFTYDGLQIKVGNNISTLSGKFPLQYNKKEDGGMYIFDSIVDICMAIYYDSNNVITKVKLQQSLL